MKELTEDLKFRIHKSHAGGWGTTCHWDDIYDTEEELLKDLFNEAVKTEGYQYQLCRGYEFIKGFRTYYTKNGHLTEKQMIQLKRLAPEIAYQIYCRRYCK